MTTISEALLGPARSKSLASAGLTCMRLRNANVARCQDATGFNHQLSSWSEAEWANAAGGENGELVETLLLMLVATQKLGNAQNLAKKLLRFRDDVRGNKKAYDEYVDDICSEAAGTVIYIDLLLARVGRSLEAALINEFNSKSEEIGYDGRL